MTDFVLDNSVVMAWAFDERSDAARAAVHRLEDSTALVPSVWPLEFSNALLVAERRGRIVEAAVSRIRGIVSSLPIHVIADHPPRVMTEVLALARAHGLTVYDASYLDLAMRQGLPLASLDEDLVAAAKRCGVRLMV